MTGLRAAAPEGKLLLLSDSLAVEECCNPLHQSGAKGKKEMEEVSVSMKLKRDDYSNKLAIRI